MNIIGGEKREGQGAAFEAINPSTSAPSWSGRASDAADVNDAVTAARQAFLPGRAPISLSGSPLLNAFGISSRRARRSSPS